MIPSSPVIQKHRVAVQQRPTACTDAILQVRSRDSSPNSHPSSAAHSRSSSTQRPSFGSVQEDITGITQSFLDSQPSHAMALVEIQTPDFCCPCSGFRGWKQIRLGGRKLSKSYSDLRLLGRGPYRGWAWDEAGSLSPNANEEKKSTSKGTPITKLPNEVLVEIVSYLAVDVPSNGYTPRNMDLISCLLTCRTLHSATLSVLYRHITIPHSVIFSKFLKHLTGYPALGTIVRRLDFSHFTSVGLGRTQQMNWEIQNLTSQTLLQCLDLLPNLKEVLFQEHLENDISTAVVRKVFTDFHNLCAVDFCGCSSQAFSSRFLEALTQNQDLSPALPQLKRISLHGCSSLSPAAIEALLPRLTSLTHLDVAYTQINAAALFSIPETARITHLNLARCTRLTGTQVIKFLTTHPSVTDSLVYLNLMTDASRYRLLDEQDVKAVLQTLSPSLRSLNLGGAKITSEHLPELVSLTKHLEELGLSGADLSIGDLNTFFTLSSQSTTQGSESTITPVEQLPALHYLDLTKVSSISLSALFNQKSCLLATPQSFPLEVIELSDKIIAPLRERTKWSKVGAGWTVRELGRRSWYVREPVLPASVLGRSQNLLDDGSRWWKMGARCWGMRKIPVMVGDVGGIYGHYMFKK